MTKKTLAILLVLAFVFIAGCDPQPCPQTKSCDDVSPLAGSWKTTEAKNPWMLKFDDSGQLIEFKHSDGQSITKTDIDNGQYVSKDKNITCELGPCEANFDSATKEVSVNIIINKYTAKIGGTEFNFKMTDIFAGKLASDGKSLEMTQVSAKSIINDGKANKSDSATKTIKFVKIP
ncbi:MAG: hypothetical protein JEZ07_14165 [Phycisphaerae bacterium]|nr:hypothetical protein [Phycisphaerae bacterium]